MKSPVIVAVMSSLSQRRGRREHADDQADERLGQARARDVVADVAAGLAALDQLAQRVDEAALELVGAGALPLAGQDHERGCPCRRGRARRERCPRRVPPRRSGPTPIAPRRRARPPGPARRAGPRDWGNSGRPWPGRRPRPRRRRSCSPARRRWRTAALHRRGSLRRLAAGGRAGGLARASSSRNDLTPSLDETWYVSPRVGAVPTPQEVVDVVVGTGQDRSPRDAVQRCVAAVPSSQTGREHGRRGELRHPRGAGSRSPRQRCAGRCRPAGR